MLAQLQATPAMVGEFRARCVDSYRPGARNVAAILADALRLQGLECLTAAGTANVLAVAPGHSVSHRRTFDLMLVADEDLLEDPETLVGLEPDGVLVVATARPPHAVRRQLRRYGGTVVTVNADAICAATGTDVGLPLLGAACRALPYLDHTAISQAVWDHYAGAWPNAGNASCRALNEGFSQAAF